MATPNAQSIVDFLKQRGFVPEQGEKFPLFQQRKRLFEQFNLSPDAGEFRGTASENLALLSRLGESERESGVGITPENILDMTRVGGAQARESIKSQSTGAELGGVTFERIPIKFFKNTQGIIQAGTALPQGAIEVSRAEAQQFSDLVRSTGGRNVKTSGGIFNIGAEDLNKALAGGQGTQVRITGGLEKLGKQDFDPNFLEESFIQSRLQELGGQQFQSLGATGIPSTTAQPTKTPREGVDSRTLPATNVDSRTLPQTEPKIVNLDGSPRIPEVLRGLATRAQGGGSQIPSEASVARQALQQFTSSTEFAFAQEEAQAGGAAVRLRAERDTQAFIKNIASRGLFFSGARKAGVSAIEVDKLASLLGVDRRFAKIIATGLQTAAQDLVKEAKAEIKTGRKEATDALGQLGFVLLPDGTLVQKPSEARAAETAEISRAREARIVEKEAEPDILSVAEAKSLGVPFGTTKEEAFGITPPRTEAVSKISINEAKALGLPLSLVGEGEQQVLTELASSTIPQWFREGVPLVLSQTGIQTLWNEFRSRINSQSGGGFDFDDF